MKTIQLTVELTYDQETMHDSNKAGIELFKNLLLNTKDGELLLHSQVIGDTVGSISVNAVHGLGVPYD